MHARTNARTHERTSAHTHTRTHARTHTHTHTHTYIHTHKHHKEKLVEISLFRDFKMIAIVLLEDRQADKQTEGLQALII